jgi:hypothetical protein
VGEGPFVVAAPTNVQAGADSFRLFRLDESAKKWLLAPSSDQRAAFLVVEGSTSEAVGSPEKGSTMSGEGTVIAGTRKADARTVTFSIQGGGDGSTDFTLVLNWPNEQQSFSGQEVALEEIEIFPAASQTA